MNKAGSRSALFTQPAGLASVWLRLLNVGCGGAPTGDAGGVAKLDAAYWLNKAICEASVASAVVVPLTVVVLAV